MEGRGAGNVDVPILFSNYFNEFQALMQEIKSQRMIMTAIMEEMKHQSQSIQENPRERGQLRQKIASKFERKFSNELGGSILRTYEKLVNFTAHSCRQRLDTFLPIGERVVLWRNSLKGIHQGIE